MKSKNGQQEMVGFVLIVVMVVIGLMVFLVISLRDSGEIPESIEVENLLDVLMRSTSGCAPVYEPNYASFEDLFKDCFEGRQCNNLEKPSCEYLNESLHGVLSDIFATEATVSYYSLDFLKRDDVGEEGILRVFEGNCTGEVSGAQRRIDAGSEDLIIAINICRS
jgi:hypothetical protein